MGTGKSWEELESMLASNDFVHDSEDTTKGREKEYIVSAGGDESLRGSAPRPGRGNWRL